MMSRSAASPLPFSASSVCPISVVKGVRSSCDVCVETFQLMVRSLQAFEHGVELLNQRLHFLLCAAPSSRSCEPFGDETHRLLRQFVDRLERSTHQPRS